MTAVATPQAQLFDRLIAQGKDSESWAYLVLSACDGEAGLARYLDDGVEPPKPKKPVKGKAKGKDGKETEVPESPRAYLDTIAVRGFRGIGPESAVKLRPGPGLTLVIGRNGSGKSSFAEALEVLLTGTSVRWADKGSRFWKEGWRNLHDGVEPQVRVRLLAEGIGQVELTRSWTAEQEVDDGTTVATGAGKKLTDLAGLGWESAVQDFRPFMSHSELASRFEDGPTVLYRALLKGLGLEAFEGIRECLAKAQAARRKQKSEAKDTAKLLIEEAKRVQAATPDERIAETITLLGAKDFDLDRLGALATGTNADQASLLSLLAQVAREKGPDVAIATQTAEGLRFAAKAMRDLAAQEAGRSAEVAALLQAALTLTDEDRRHRVSRLRDAGRDRRRLARAHGGRGDAAARVGEGAAGGAAAAARAGARRAGALRRRRPSGSRIRGSTKRRDARARRVEGVARRAEDRGRRRAGRAPRAARRAAGVRAGGARRVGRARDRRAPGRLAADRAEARAVGRGRPRGARGQQQVADLKKAEDWVKDAIDDLRTERFEPIAAKARDVLGPDAAAEQRRPDRDQARRHRQGAVGRPRGHRRRQAGRRARRHVAGRAELAGAEPVPAARVAAGQPVRVRASSTTPSRRWIRRASKASRACSRRRAKQRQVVVFTHDDRLPEAVKRLQIEAGHGRGHAARELGRRGPQEARARRRLPRGRAVR